MQIKKIQHVPTSPHYHAETLAMTLKHVESTFDDRMWAELQRRVSIIARFTGEPRENIWNFFLRQCEPN